MIPQTVRELVYGSRYCQASIQEVADLLPPDSAEVDEWLSEAITAEDPMLFTYLSLAVAVAARPFRAIHLAGGLHLWPNSILLGWFVWNAVDRVPEAVMRAMSGPTFPDEHKAVALFVVKAWCQEHADHPLPATLVPEARQIARRKNPEPAIRGPLIALAGLTQDRPLQTLPGVEISAKITPRIDEYLKAAIERYSLPPLDLIPVNPPRELAHGATMRRSVERIGRNENCPCGSGKKYKRCCYDKDQERLHRSTSVAGKTYADLRAEPEAHLTRAKLQRLGAPDLARLDPLKVPEDLIDDYLVGLTVAGLFEQLADAHEKLPWAGENPDTNWWGSMLWTAKSWRRDIAELLKTHPDPTAALQKYPGYELFLADCDPASFLDTLERLAGRAVESTDKDYLEHLALGVLFSPYRALGILVARSMLSIVPQQEAANLFDEILTARDKLNLSPDDRFSDIIDERFTEDTSHHEGQEGDQVRHAQRKLAEKAREVRRLKEILERTRREITRHETPPATASPASSSAPDPQILSDLRDKVRQLKSNLTERHEERATLRRELQTAQADLAALQQAIPAASPNDRENPATDPEEDLLLPGEVDGNQPVRLIEFPKKFRQTLARYPRPTARAAVSMIGRLAAGEPGAYVGVVRLKACHEILRQRIGSDYRLLFQLDSENLRVIDLVNRKDLATTIKHLRLTPPNL